MIVLQNDDLRLELDASNGAIVQLGNLARDVRLISGPVGASWALRLEDGSRLTKVASFSADRVQDGLRLRWTSERGDLIEATVVLAGGEPAARFRPTLIPAAEEPRPVALEYPIFTGIGELSGDDRLLHSYATGFLFHDPLRLFRPDGEDSTRGILHAPYPEGFSGTTLQLMAYYAHLRGGFSFATEDGDGALKWLNFFKDGDWLQAVIAHGAADVERPIEPAYDVVVGALLEGTWTEAADRYKTWAVRQRWCHRGPLAERPEQERRLHEEVGLVTFGINAAHDRSTWLRALRELAGTTVMHVLGPNWTHQPQDYSKHLPGGIADWLPARFHPANVDTIRSQGDWLVPFEFDLLFGRDGTERDAGTAALQSIPSPTLSFDAYEFPFLCPTTSFLQRLHRERDERLVEEHGVDGVYYDISINNVIARCDDNAHGHPRGGGAFMVEAYRELFDAPAIPRGTEMVNEIYLDRLDFYQARAEASPVSSFEADKFRAWIKDEQAEKVPLFAYVYHEFGPVRMDGWAKLSREQGELFYWIGARVLVWGGLFELNYEFSPLETIDGVPEPLDEHYFPLPDRRYEIDPDKAAFVRELATARTGPANPYLAFGTMLPPLEIVAPSVELEWSHYNCPTGWPAFADSGARQVPAVVHGAWRHGEAAAVVLVNLDRVEHAVRVPANSSTLRLDRDIAYEAKLIEGEERMPLGPVTAGGWFSIPLPPRRVVVVEVTCAS